MPKYNFIKNAFLGGEVSPKALGRTDLPQYPYACKTLKNWVPLVGGGATKRPGSQILFETTGNGKARLIPFVVSKDESYLIEVNATEVKFYNIQDGTVGLLGVNPWNVAQLDDIQFVQNADVMWLVHKDVKPQILARIDINTFAVYDWNDESTLYSTYGISTRRNRGDLIPYGTANTTGSTFALSAASVGTGRTLTLAGSGPVVFDSTYVGRYFMMGNASGSYGTFVVTAFTNSTHLTVEILRACPSTAATTDWIEGSWSDARGWPSTVAFFGLRLIFGGSDTYPDTLWASEAGNYWELNPYNLSALGADQEAFDRSLASPELNRIHWMAARGNTLVVGTLGSEWICESSDPAADFSATTAATREQTNHGSISHMPVKAANGILFATRTGRRVREFLFNFQTDSYEAEDMSVLADHLPGKTLGYPAPIKQLAWSESDNLLWGIDTGGGLFSLTRSRKQNVAAWAHHELAGTYTPLIGDPTPPIVHSICTVPSDDSIHDDLYACVEITVAGSNYFHVLRIGKEFLYDAASNDLASGDEACYYMDYAYYKDNGSAQTSWTLNAIYTAWYGQTVYVVADGIYIGAKTLGAAGQLTLSTAASRIVVGFPYNSDIETMPLEAGTQIGAAMGSLSRIDRLVVRLDRAVGLKYGPDEDNLKEMVFNAGLGAGEEIPFFTGIKDVSFDGGQSREPTVFLRHDYPYPCSIVSLTTRGVLNDG